MDLNRQTLGREEEFDHDRRIVADGVREPDFAHAAITEIPKIAGNVDAPPWLVDDDRFEAGKHGGTMLGRSPGGKGTQSGCAIDMVAVTSVWRGDPGGTAAVRARGGVEGVDKEGGG